MFRARRAEQTTTNGSRQVMVLAKDEPGVLVTG